MTPTTRRPTTAACRQRSALYLSTGSVAAPLFDSTLVLRGLLRPLALDAADDLVERRQECRAITRRKGLWAAGDFARRTQVGHQVAHRQRHADGLLGERLAVRRDHLGARFHAAAGERDVRGNDDIAFAGAFRD